MLKDKVITVLKSSDDFVSGEYLANQFGTSRMNISNIIKELSDDGYVFVKKTRKGYKLQSSPNILSVVEVSQYLDCENNLVYLEETTSTNEYMKELAKSGASDGTVVFTDHQTKGKGRLGKSFYSPKNCGIYLSYLYRPTCKLNELSTLTAQVAVAVARAIETVCGIKVAVKWVNDILLNGKKICGILTELAVIGENMTAEYAIVGIGINVNNEASDFKGELHKKAGSLYSETKKKYNRAELTGEVIKNLRKLFANEKAKDLDYYKEICLNIGKEVVFEKDGKTITGIAEGLDDNNALLVKVGEETITLVSGEVSIRGVDGYY